MSKISRSRKILIAAAGIVLIAVIAAVVYANWDWKMTKPASHKPVIICSQSGTELKPSQFIKIINKELEKENLALIPEKYTSREFGEMYRGYADQRKNMHYNTYTYSLGDKLFLDLITFREADNQVTDLELHYERSHSKADLKNCTSSDDDRIAAYFTVICDSIEPEINVDSLVKHGGWANPCCVNNVVLEMNSDFEGTGVRKKKCPIGSMRLGIGKMSIDDFDDESQ